MSVKMVHVEELREKLQRGEKLELLDVRTPAEFQEIHATGAKLVPLDRLDAKGYLSQRPERDGPIYVLCRSGNRAKKACEAFLAEGFAEAYCVEGGTLAWEKAGLPVVRGKKTISLERQVRIVAGALTLLGSILGFFVHPYFIAIPALMGAGLVFAGITDTCGLGMILDRMPWNQAGEPACAAGPAKKDATCSSV